ncbi:MAG TPA: hypothetical protein VGM92_08895 [Candidatus Kapabacteria bacterium]
MTQKMLLVFGMAIFATVLSGCALFAPTPKPAPVGPPYAPISDALSDEYLHSPTGDVAAHYPKDWLLVDIQTIPMKNVEEVYTDHDRRWALVLAEIPATAEFRRSLARDGMAALAEQSFDEKSGKASAKLTISRPAEIYSENGKLFSSYEYSEAGADSITGIVNREVLFTTGAKFYELGMVSLSPTPGSEERIQNFRLLESVTASLEGVAEIQQDTTFQ